MELILKHWIDQPNAGDAFSRDVAEKYIGPVAAVAEGNPLDQTNLLLIGSIMGWADEHSIVCGTGMISPTQFPRSKPKEVVSVRGPITRQFLRQADIDVPDRFGDAGILAADFMPNPPKPKYRCGVILHHSEKWLWPKIYYKKFFTRQEILFIDISLDPMNVFEKICQCELIFSSSLHGLIFAHALGRRAAWIEASDRLVGKGFKFYDYFLSVGVPPDAVPQIKLQGVEDLSRYDHLAREISLDKLTVQVREALEIVKSRFS
ncbi:polysaccharide pyruvyl transferase family protein [Roseiarcaceae bacterium H3SJ34-1]|uniref:polysaccharide pyruvyl transferase family protein n=1 Tax=Terripilifer ovatus TaxID=3032367 RepID=UPI003AB989DD|nr:polysaccharide pyruvyl transferase family protein [Roseiarcaceae bacterium H3SJ34-1]